MKKMLIGISVALLVTPANSQSSWDDLSEQMTYFYTDSSDTTFESFQKKIDSHQKELKMMARNNYVVPVMIARISEEKGWPITSIAFGSRAKEILEGKTRFAKIVADDSKVGIVRIRIWWASFFATGNDKYLDKIFKHAVVDPEKGDSVVDPEKSDYYRRLAEYFRGKAREIIRSNCIQHEAVRKFAEIKLKESKHTQNETQFLKSCIDDAVGKQNKGLDNNRPLQQNQSQNEIQTLNHNEGFTRAVSQPLSLNEAEKTRCYFPYASYCLACFVWDCYLAIL